MVSEEQVSCLSKEGCRLGSVFQAEGDVKKARTLGKLQFHVLRLAGVTFKLLFKEKPISGTNEINVSHYY